MKNSFWWLIWSSFLEVQGPIIAIVGISATILLPRFINAKIPLDFFVFTLLCFLITVLTFLQAAYKSFQESKKRLSPRILSARYWDKEKLKIDLLLESSELLSNRMYVSFYYTDNHGFESLIGTGVILTVQGNGKIRALLDNPESSYRDILENLAENKFNLSDKIRVNPGITKDLLLKLYFGDETDE